ncbi:MAG TPA: hypothetical protein DEQ47_14285 [Solibacterales bacterium]|nr:hypothetical protein [Bryobacterales bacterium]
MRKRSALFSVANLLLAAATVNVPTLRADQTVACRPSGPSRTVCRIDEPNVRQQLTPYRQVTFHAGDRVIVNAGGCVQTGGHGATWKRYVNPSGPDSNRLYWGTISIPGATQGVVRVSSVLGRQLTVPAGLPDSDLYLGLGYVDDGYGDNGYNDHDDGTENQCKGSVNAFVILTIDHQPGTTAGCGGTTGNNPLDMVWSDCDPNGYPKNPQWRYQVTHNGQVPPAPPTLCPSLLHGNPCTAWTVTTDSGTLCGPHVNWFAATYNGLVSWEEKSDVGTDDDYNYRFFTPRDAGVVAHPDGTINGIEIEFDSDETIDHFSSPLWTQFHHLVDNNNSAAQTQVKTRTAVVMGLVGLDCGHPSCSSELHPAYGMAVNVDNSNLADDRWTVFARNWGDEGFCSSDQHYLPTNNVKLMIPWLAGATSVTVGPDTQFYVFTNSDSSATASSPQITYAANQGVLLDFNLPAPSAQVGIEGEVHLQWTLAGGARTTTRILRPALPLAIIHPNRAEPEKDKPEMRVSGLVKQMTAPQLQMLRTRLQAASVARVGINRPRLALRSSARVAALPQPPRLAKPLATQAVRDPRMVRKHEALRTSLCETYKNAVPGYPSACTAAPAH